jgi:hypothetical protein
LKSGCPKCANWRNLDSRLDASIPTQRTQNIGAAIDRLPPIVVARDGVLVDGHHRWQAYKREGVDEIDVENLGNLSDIEIIKEAIRRNAKHGRQLETKDKRRLADQLWRQGMRDDGELADLLSITESTLETYLRDAKRDEKDAQKAKAWDLWLDCLSTREIAEQVGITHPTVSEWVEEIGKDSKFFQPPDSRQHFDVWQFQQADGDSRYFGKMLPQVVENLLWFYTEPGDIVVDPMAGGGTTVDVAKAMGRRVWASDLHPSTPMLPIHEHDICSGWPKDAPKQAKQLSAGHTFRETFQRAGLDMLRAADISRPRVGRGAVQTSLSEMTARARDYVWSRIAALGGIDSLPGSCCWAVLGLEQSLNGWAIERSLYNRRVEPQEARGILVAVLTVLALNTTSTIWVPPRPRMPEAAAAQIRSWVQPAVAPDVAPA